MMMTRREFVSGAVAMVSGMTTSMAQSARQAATDRAFKALRVAQVGVQGHFGDIVTGIPKVEGCSLVAVARSFPDEPVEQLKEKPVWNPDTRIFDDYRQMLDEVRPDIVAAFAPYAHNGQVSIEAVRRGCHVISEKPLASTLEDLDALRAERDRAKVRVTAMLAMRFHPGLMAAHKAVQEGSIGEPLLISAQKSYAWGQGRPWYFKLRKNYGGSIPWVAIHAIDFIRFVTGLDFTSVTARQAVKVHKDYPECEDCGALLFDMSNGGQATLTFDYFRPPKAGSHGDDRLRVAGSRGVVEVRITNTTFCELITDEQGPAQLPLSDESHNIFIDFVESLRGLRPHFLSEEDPFRATEVALKARDSADRRVTVAL
ncbi:MAG TPA: Gfo/Idh/MocA family oxidoreductase [Phycisphaerae bacterium]|nr:Gfo/Idh/MocA family oxidoreductase [Phycisphaerae bacterium]HRR86527.1 Gfo/Idh/MocA family oxidoreductase [Phycisphaerae bacterium]